MLDQHGATQNTLGAIVESSMSRRKVLERRTRTHSSPAPGASKAGRAHRERAGRARARPANAAAGKWPGTGERREGRSPT